MQKNEMFSQAKKSFSPKQIFVSFILFIIGFGIYTSFYAISAESVGVIQRFGQFQKIVQPGLHLKLPYGIETVTQVPIRRQLKEEFGFGTAGATFSDQISPPEEWRLVTIMVTGDLNTALVEWVVQFRVEDAFDFLFKVRNPGAALRDISESVMRDVVGDRTVDEVLTIGRQEIEDNAARKMQEVVNLYQMGLRIDQVQLKNVNPPLPVKPSFDEVNQAQQERERVINVARGEYNKAIPAAKGIADQAILAAEGYAIQRENNANGDTAKFNALLVEYNKAPRVTQRRLYLENMSSVLPKLKSKIVIDHKTRSLLPLLPLDKISGVK